jgi:hypothetical protein
MKSILHLPLVLAFVLLASVLCAQPAYELDTAFSEIRPASFADPYLLVPIDRHRIVVCHGTIPQSEPFVEHDTTGTPTGRVYQFPSTLQSRSYHKIAADAQGNAYLLGSYDDSNSALYPRVMAVCKFKPDGTIDTGYGQQGICRLPGTDYTRTAHHLAVAADGSLQFVVASTYVFTPREYVLYKFTAAGSIDSTWNPNGQASLVVTNRGVYAYHTTMDGTLYATLGNNSSLITQEVYKWRPDGSRDSSFQQTGSYKIEVYSSTPDGRVVTLHQPHPDYPIQMRRFLPNSTLDPTYSAPLIHDTLYPRLIGHWPRPGGGFQMMFTTYSYAWLPYGHDFHIYSYNSDGEPDLLAMPGGEPIAFYPDQSRWYMPECLPSATQNLSQVLMLNNHRLILSDFMLKITQAHVSAPLEYWYCPRVLSVHVRSQRSVGVESVAAPGHVILAPNPVSDHLSVVIPTRSKPTQIQLFDLTGKAVPLPAARSSVVEGGWQYQFDEVADLPHGLYLLRITAGGQHYTAKVCKQ